MDIDTGIFPDFLSETTHVRNSEWSVSPVKNDFTFTTIFIGEYRAIRDSELFPKIRDYNIFRGELL